MKLISILALLASTPAFACDWGMTKYTCYREDNDPFNAGCRTRTAALRGCAWTQVEAQASCFAMASVRLWWNNWLPDTERDCSGRPAVTEGSVNLCNRTTETVFYSLVYSQGGGWVVKGWWTLEPQQCRKEVYQIGTGVYVHADSKSNNYVGGDLNQCVHPVNAFEHPAAGGACVNGLVERGFRKFDKAGAYGWDF